MTVDDQLIDKWTPLLLYTLWKSSPDLSEEERVDLVQETWLDFISQLKKSNAKEIAAPKAYLCRILLNNLVDFKRKSQKAEASEEDLTYHPWEGPDQYDRQWEQRFDAEDFWRKEFMSAPEKENVNKEIRAHLNECMKSLPSIQQHIFIMREIDLLDHQSIAEKFEKKPNSIRQQLVRAKNKLKDCLSGHFT